MNCLKQAIAFELGPGPGRLGFGLGGQGSWAGPAWVWLGGPRVLGRAGLVLNTLKNHDGDGDVNIILGRTMIVMWMSTSYLEEP